MQKHLLILSCSLTLALCSACRHHLGIGHSSHFIDLNVNTTIKVEPGSPLEITLRHVDESSKVCLFELKNRLNNESIEKQIEQGSYFEPALWFGKRNLRLYKIERDRVVLQVIEARPVP
jgi:hypothetical protein